MRDTRKPDATTAEQANGKLRHSFAVAGAAVVLPLLAVFAFNTLWGYLPLRRDMVAVPGFVDATNSMRDLEIAVLRSATPVRGSRVHQGYRASLPADAAINGVPGQAGDAAADADARVMLGPVEAYEAAAERVRTRFAEARRAVAEWPQILQDTSGLYGEWLVLRRQGRALAALSAAQAASPFYAAEFAEYDRLNHKLVNGIETLNHRISTTIRERMGRESAHSQRVVGLSMAIGFMVIVFIMYVNLRLARYVVDPVNGLVGSITRFREGDYTVRTDVKRADEIGNLADAFNGMAQDIEQSHQHLASLSERDPLTGMLNRRGFDTRFERHLKQADALGQELAVIMVDIDRFKSINDTYGHATGDLVLVAVADTIRNCLRGGDFSARFGGEEFIVCLPEKSAETGIAVAERMRQAIDRLPLTTTDGAPIHVTASAGVAIYPTAGMTRNALVEAGDAALYAAKRNGRNRVELAAVSDIGFEKAAPAAMPAAPELDDSVMFVERASPQPVVQEPRPVQRVAGADDADSGADVFAQQAAARDAFEHDGPRLVSEPGADVFAAPDAADAVVEDDTPLEISNSIPRLQRTA